MGLGAIGLGAFTLLCLFAFSARRHTARKHKAPRREYHPEHRQAYHLSWARTCAALAASIVGALAATLVLARWLPYPALESTLLGTLLAPLLWPPLLIYLLISSRWKKLSVACGASGAIALAIIALLTVG